MEGEGKPHIVRALEIYAGIGGYAAAVENTNVKVVAAFDQSPFAREAYAANFPRHNICSRNLEHVTREELSNYRADFWWLSPPCQPYTVRGKMKDEDDPRAASLKRLIEVMGEMDEGELPFSLALENVEGFGRSRMRARFIQLIEERRFTWKEFFLCPTMLGVPMRRPRYYLVASLGVLRDVREPEETPLRPIKDYLKDFEATVKTPELLVPPSVWERFGKGFHVIDSTSEGVYATCFTSAYGRSFMRSGSYLKTSHGVRRFSPEEILRLMGFPESYSFPPQFSIPHRWRLVGNSLSVTVVRWLLKCFPEIRELRSPPVMIISGGQTGADRAALDFAMEEGIPHGGWVPRGRLAEDGALDKRYHVWETENSSYSDRTERNVLEAHGTLIVSRGPLTGGSSFTRLCAIRRGKPYLHVDLTQTPSLPAAAEVIRRWMKEHTVQVMNIAGPRASTDPCIYGLVLELLAEVFKRD